MYPAPSIIAFSTLSGLGFGLMFWLGIGMPGSTGLVAFVFFAIAYVLAGAGLIASTFHLGHPERALLAFTQWRSSWLSREAVGAVAALAGILRGILDTHWMAGRGPVADDCADHVDDLRTDENRSPLA